MFTHLSTPLRKPLTIALGLLVILATGSLSAIQDVPAKPKFSVKIQDEKATIVDVEGSGAIDPQQRISFGSQGNFYINVNTIRGETLHLSHFPNFMINGRFMTPGQGGRFENLNAPLPKTPSGKARVGNSSTWIIDNLRITQSVELIPTKAKGPGQKRLMNSVLISYSAENKSAQSQNFGLRVYMDTYVINNDGCMFASPTTHPKRILDGIHLTDKMLPSYLQMLQVPNLDNPGYVAHLTLNLGSRFEKAQKVTLTRHGAGFGNWDMPALPSMGDSGMGIFWNVKELKPGGKREMAYAYGEGIAVPPESEGRFQVSLGGSFEPGKIFTISAVVADPIVGQSLALELPAGMERLEGRDIEPIAPLTQDQEYTTVLWKARVLRTGDHTIRIRSSNGVTQTKIVSVTANK